MPGANVFEAQFEYDKDDPEGYQSGGADVGKLAGGEALAVRLFELPAGQALCPYHYEYVEEWLLVLEGTAVVRVPDGETEARAGELICFPPGSPGAHKVMNPGPAVARVLMFSSASVPAVAVYPDSDKIGVWPGNEDDNVMLRRADGQVGYWEGERA
jgi:uncharacterized cupin superfamily protein